jgi:hypothetical protein
LVLLAALRPAIRRDADVVDPNPALEAIAARTTTLVLAGTGLDGKNHLITLRAEEARAFLRLIRLVPYHRRAYEVVTTSLGDPQVIAIDDRGKAIRTLRILRGDSIGGIVSSDADVEMSSRVALKTTLANLGFADYVLTNQPFSGDNRK